MVKKQPSYIDYESAEITSSTASAAHSSTYYKSKKKHKHKFDETGYCFCTRGDGTYSVERISICSCGHCETMFFYTKKRFPISTSKEELVEQFLNKVKWDELFDLDNKPSWYRPQIEPEPTPGAKIYLTSKSANKNSLNITEIEYIGEIPLERTPINNEISKSR